MGVTLYLWMVDLVYFHGKIPLKWMITGGSPMTQETTILSSFGSLGSLYTGIPNLAEK